YQDYFATIVPLLNGNGTRLKILESVTYGRPVLTTLKGMEGLDFINKRDIFVFNKDPKTFIDSYETLLNKEFYKVITENAYKVLESRYSYPVFQSDMDKNWNLIKN